MDGEGFIDLGLDNIYEFDDNANLNGKTSAAYRITDIYNQNYWTPQM